MAAVSVSVDGQAETFSDLQFSMPRVVYSFTVPGEAGMRRVLGGWGFGIVITGPSDRLLALHADRRACEVELRYEALELGPILVLFDQLIETPQVPVLFGHSPHGDAPPQWQETPS